MATCTTEPKRPKSVHRRLIAQHFHQILGRTEEDHDRLCNVFAITFRPGNRTGCFSEPVRKLGQGVLICLTYGRDQMGRRTMSVRGFRAQINPNGFVTYGGEGSLLFHHDVARRPSIHSHGQPLNPLKNPSLTELAIRMDRSCHRALGRIRWLPSVPHLPQVMLSFSVNGPPTYEDSAALRELAAIEMGIPMEELGRNGEVLLERLLRDVWGRQLLHPGDPANNSGTFLISADFCTQARRSLFAFEDFSALLGAAVSNPARRASPLGIPNPAADILKQFGIDSLEQPITDEDLAAMVAGLRRAVGPDIPVTETEVFDAFANSNQPLRAWSPRLTALRAQLEPSMSETVTDDDLMRAAASPEQPLIASLGCKIQVLQRQSGNVAETLDFTPEDLGRRIELDRISSHCRI